MKKLPKWLLIGGKSGAYFRQATPSYRVYLQEASKAQTAHCRAARGMVARIVDEVLGGARRFLWTRPENRGISTCAANRGTGSDNDAGRGGGGQSIKTFTDPARCELQYYRRKSGRTATDLSRWRRRAHC